MVSAIFEKIDMHLQNHRMGTWTGTFRDYLGMVIKQPSLAQRAHARLYNMEQDHRGVKRVTRPQILGLLTSRFLAQHAAFWPVPPGCTSPP